MWFREKIQYLQGVTSYKDTTKFLGGLTINRGVRSFFCKLGKASNKLKWLAKN